MNEITKKARIKQLMTMHLFMLNANDESIYLSWVALGVPDCPSEDDYEFIAENDETYKECCDLFRELVNMKGWMY